MIETAVHVPERWTWEQLHERGEQLREQQHTRQQLADAVRPVMAAPILIPPVPALAALRRTVLAMRDDRCPKWRFRL